MVMYIIFHRGVICQTLEGRSPMGMSAFLLTLLNWIYLNFPIMGHLLSRCKKSSIVRFYTILNTTGKGLIRMLQHIQYIIQKSKMKVSTHKGRHNTNFEVNEMGKKIANKKANELDTTLHSKSCQKSLKLPISSLTECASTTIPHMEHQEKLFLAILPGLPFLPFCFDKCLFFLRYYCFAIKYFQREKKPQ